MTSRKINPISVCEFCVSFRRAPGLWLSYDLHSRRAEWSAVLININDIPRIGRPQVLEFMEIIKYYHLNKISFDLKWYRIKTAKKMKRDIMVECFFSHHNRIVYKTILMVKCLPVYFQIKKNDFAITIHTNTKIHQILNHRRWVGIQHLMKTLCCWWTLHQLTKHMQIPSCWGASIYQTTSLCIYLFSKFSQRFSFKSLRKIFSIILRSSSSTGANSIRRSLGLGYCCVYWLP